MTKTIISVAFCVLAIGCLSLSAQEVQNATIEQQLENIAEAEEADPTDDSYQQQLQQYRRLPLDINSATVSELQVFRWLTDLQIQNLLQYRRLLGRLVSIYELQAVPGWDMEAISKTRPFIVAGTGERLSEVFRTRISKGDHTLLLRLSQTFEKSRGFIAEDSAGPKYPGSPQRLLVRYKYNYKNLLQFGVLGEKDPGEQFLKGAQRVGFDFYSFHFFVRQYKSIRQLAIGDFTVNIGQGLLAYQSLAFRKSVDVMNIKRQTELFRPYNSAGEYNFFRGVAIHMGQRRWQYAAFFSMQKVSANAVVDTVNNEDYVSSILTSGLHRTMSEVVDRKIINQMAMGGSIHYRSTKLYWGLNGIHYRLEKPLQRDNAPYTQFAFSGKALTSISTDYHYTWKSLHWFGEIAANANGGGLAAINGIVASIDPKVDVSLLYRKIGRDYKSLYANAFTESTTPINEKGLYTGISIRPKYTLRIDAYADVFSFPWLRYRVDRPSEGKEYLVQLTWKPNKQVELYSRFRHERKAINLSDNPLPFAQTEDIIRINWRTQLSYKLSQAITVRTRVEMVWYDRGGPQASEGFMVFGDFFYKPMLSKLALNARLQYFETGDYNSRIYAYENDVLYSYSIPPFSGKGFRTYFNLNYDVSQWATLWLRVARTVYPDADSIGSGYDEIAGNHRTDLRVQMLFKL